MSYAEMVIEAFEVPAEPGIDPNAERFRVRVLSSPAGEMRSEDAALCSYNRLQLQEQLNQIDTRALARDGLITFGRQLADWLLPPKQAQDSSSVRDLYESCLAQVGQDGGLRLRLRLSPLLARIPWEFLYIDPPGGSGQMDGFLALDPRIAIVRHETLPMPIPTVQPPADQMLKVVAALALTDDQVQLNLEQERVNLEQIFRTRSVTHEFIEQATIVDILAQVDDAHIFHFAGHGEFKTTRTERARTYVGAGGLELADQRVESEQLSLNLRGNRLRLAVLGACETARRGGANIINPWGALAPMLAKVGIPAVVANQFRIRDNCALAFSQGLYQALFGGASIERAVTAGRLAAYNADKEGRDWGIPALYMRAANGQLFSGVTDQQVRQKAAAQTERLITQVRGDIITVGNITSSTGVAIGRDAEARSDTTSAASSAAWPEQPDPARPADPQPDEVSSDVMNVGNITGSSAVAIGRGASAAVRRSRTDQDRPDMFARYYSRVASSAEDAAIKQLLVEKLQALAFEAARGSQADDARIEGALKLLARYAPDLFDSQLIDELRQAVEVARLTAS